MSNLNHPYDDLRTRSEKKSVRYYNKKSEHAFDIFEEYDGMCYYCGHKHDRLIDDDVQLEHAIPKSRGGKDEVGNLVIACVECNKLKSIYTPSQFMDLLNKFFTEEINEWPGDNKEIRFEKSWKKYEENGVSNSEELNIKEASERLKYMANT